MTDNEIIIETLKYMLDHYKYFKAFPMDIELDEDIYKLDEVIQAFMNLKREEG